MFVFHETATTETYTYLHPRPLHAALPIFDGVRQARDGAPRAEHLLFRRSQQRRFSEGSAVTEPPRRSVLSLKSAPAKAAPEIRWKRSEEHTSELQSLMRISYAVFCLKKKITHTHDKSRQLLNKYKK